MNSIDPSDTVRLALGSSSEVEDALLAELNDVPLPSAWPPAVPEQREPLAPRGAFSIEAHASRPLENFRGNGSYGLDHGGEEAPFDVEVVRPRVLDLRRLYDAAKKELPKDIQATLGPNRPLLICHGMTPFHRPGERPSSVWGMGYESELARMDGSTVAFCPSSETLSVGSVQQSLQIGVGCGGELDVPKEALQILNVVPGVKITGAELGVTTHTRFGLALSLTLALRAIQAGPVGAGGVRWQIYHTKDRLDCYQPLFQTLLVGHSEPELRFRVRTWVRSRGFFGLWAKQWTSEWETFTVPLRRGASLP